MALRSRIIPLLGFAAAAAAVPPVLGLAAPGSALPDLRSDAPARPLLERASGDRLLLRFDGYVTNIGRGPLDVTGNPSVPGGMKQRRHDGRDSWTAVRSPLVRYDTADGHDHFHLMNVMRYSLRRGDDSAEVAPGQKVGFCLYDLSSASGAARYDDAFYAPANFCQAGNPRATSLRMGVSAGWRDDYSRDLPLQWVDVSETPPGDYRLTAETDPQDVVLESDETNNGLASVPYTLQGHVARPVGPIAVPSGGGQGITLASATFGSPGPRAFRITSAPRHGSLDVAVGATVSGDAVRYAPAPGYSGPDSFGFAAITTSGPTRGYPRTPPEATATLQVGSAPVAPALAISGAPASMVAGTSVQLQAAVTPAGPVRWTTDAGTVTADGLYVAPAAPPPGGVATVRAQSIAAPSAAAEVRIGITPVPVPVPTPGGGTTGGSGPPGLMTTPTAKRNRRTIVIRSTARADGRFLVTALRGGRAIARCRVAARSGARSACLVRVPRRFAVAPVRISVRLSTPGGRRAVTGLLSRPR